MNGDSENSQGPRTDGEDESIDGAAENWRSQAREYHVALSGLTAAHAAGLFALTQLIRMGDWGTTIATYSFAIGLPTAAAAAWESSDEPAMETARAITASLLLASLMAIVGVTGLFWHFHVGAAIVFLAAAAVSLWLYAYSPSLPAWLDESGKSPQ